MSPCPSSSVSRARLAALLPILGLAVSLLAGAVPVAAVEPWTIDDLLAAETIRQIELSPDGSLAVWSVQGLQKVGKEEKRISQLWARSLADRSAGPVQLTRGDSDVLAFRISPDGKNLAFLTERKLPGDEEIEGPQIFILPLGTGGEARRLSSFDRGVSSFEFIDNEALLVLRPESKSALEAEREKGADTSTAVADPADAPPMRLFKLTMGGKATRISRNRDWITHFTVAPDGKTAVLSAAQDLDYEFNSKVPPKTFLVDLASGAFKEIFAGEKVSPFTIRYAPDGQSVYVTDPQSSHPLYETASILQLHRYDLRSGRSEKVDLEWQRGLSESASPFWPLPAPGGKGEELFLLLADGVRFKTARLAGGKLEAVAGRHAGQIERVAFSADGKTLLYQASSLGEPTQLWAARFDGKGLSGEWQVSELNKSYPNKPKGRYEIVHFEGALGDEVEGILLYPFLYMEGKKYPLVLDIHGGPAGADFDSWDNSLNLLWRQRGAFVLQVNYHGSSSYGLPWVESIRERYYELEIPDIEAGVDALIRRGLVDPEKMASTGWSNGGILTAELITRTSRYRAAVVGAADIEWLSDWANVDFGASFDNYYFGGPPWERVQHYLDKSPFFRLDKVKTPTLIHTGTADRAVPPHQSWSLFRVLQDLGQAPVRFLTYPGEPHGLQKIAHRRRRYSEDVAWLDRYLFGAALAPGQAIPPGSALAAMLARQQASRDAAGRYGEVKGGVLLPEMVELDDPYGAANIARFEVTRAQFAAFEPGFEVEPGEENLPATGIDFAKAKAYAAWAAAKIAGARLPTKEEAEHFAGLAGKSGNTLDHWLGYRANPEDAEAARAAAAAAGESFLLRPVGQGQAQQVREQGPAVYDLDGNAAEWVIGAGGQGEAFGPSADRSSDSADTQPPGAAYTGFRLVGKP